MKKTELIGTVCEARAYDVGGAGLTIERAPIGGPARGGRENVHINGLVSHMVHGFRIGARDEYAVLLIPEPLLRMDGGSHIGEACRRA